MTSLELSDNGKQQLCQPELGIRRTDMREKCWFLLQKADTPSTVTAAWHRATSKKFRQLGKFIPAGHEDTQRMKQYD
jgi:hypothetical protein